MNAPAAASRGALLDPTRRGSGRQQLAIGAVGFVLAVLLVAGQVMVATTRGIATNVGAVNAHLETGNEVMFEIIEKAAPTPALRTAVDEQSGMLAHTRDTLVLLNAELDNIAATAGGLESATGSMQASSESVGSQVGGMANEVEEISGTLGKLPPLTGRIAAHLKRIAADSGAVNVEVDAIGNKLEGYGLPEAQGARR